MHGKPAPTDVAEAALAHSLKSVAAAYRRRTAVEKRRKVMEDGARWLSGDGICFPQLDQSLVQMAAKSGRLAGNSKLGDDGVLTSLGNSPFAPLTRAHARRHRRTKGHAMFKTLKTATAILVAMLALASPVKAAYVCTLNGANDRLALFFLPRTVADKADGVGTGTLTEIGIVKNGVETKR